MPELQDLMDQLTDAGVQFSSVDKITQFVSLSDNWTSAFVELAVTGRRLGVRMTRAPRSPTDEALHHILRGYPFDREQRSLVVRCILEIVPEPAT